MKKLLLFAFSIFLLTFPGRAQQNNQGADIAKDTAHYPYWVQMMQDPTVNFFKVQRAFNIYWQNRKITKGCGWKAIQALGIHDAKPCASKR